MTQTISFPYRHFIEEFTKVVWINYNGNGQVWRYGVPHLVKKFYPGYTYKFCSEEIIDGEVAQDLLKSVTVV